MRNQKNSLHQVNGRRGLDSLAYLVSQKHLRRDTTVKEILVDTAVMKVVQIELSTEEYDACAHRPTCSHEGCTNKYRSRDYILIQS